MMLRPGEHSLTVDVFITTYSQTSEQSLSKWPLWSLLTSRRFLENMQGKFDKFIYTQHIQNVTWEQVQ